MFVKPLKFLFKYFLLCLFGIARVNDALAIAIVRALLHICTIHRAAEAVDVLPKSVQETQRCEQDEHEKNDEEDKNKLQKCHNKSLLNYDFCCVCLRKSTDASR